MTQIKTNKNNKIHLMISGGKCALWFIRDFADIFWLHRVIRSLMHYLG